MRFEVVLESFGFGSFPVIYERLWVERGLFYRFARWLLGETLMSFETGSIVPWKSGFVFASFLSLVSC